MEKPQISFKFELEKQTPRLGPGGITRGASVREFPVSVGIAGVSMRLQPGGMRELHWHANAAEWAYVITGNARTTIIHPDGSAFIDNFGPGDVWYFPRGYGHSIQATGDKECHFILIFDNGNFSEDHTFSITDFIANTPPEVVAQNFGLTLGEVEQLPHKEAYFALGPNPDESSTIAFARAEPALTSLHRYPLEAQQPRLIPGGGTQRVASVKEFPISTSITGSVIELQPGALREMHWHPNADEWQYYLAGKAEMTVFLAEATAVTEQFNAGDVGYVPMGAGHYIKNTGDEVCRILIGFNSGNYEAIDLSQWLAGNPKDVIATNLGIGEAIVDKLPQRKLFAIPPKY
ncbi:cupin domain-containing protein [Mucilaginibacter paludis]|uniref:Bicupin, oxalate decarboxylase family n=1 Tax=Mucilaginibacter paludis DSM 18603 TaxID=714943 RepID=H1Y6E0_9SPHI|nr:cupin domain-containing protein [Mucilaginibacter paludis]EHQ24888.1 bicupin, oxalate decarboxylase family [Mucilaginibacter paludis DSM 18603]